jgi:hypothetical protein
VQAIADEIEEQLKKQSNSRPVRTEGYTTAEWVLMDYGDFIVHIFEKTHASFMISNASGAMPEGSNCRLIFNLRTDCKIYRASESKAYFTFDSLVDLQSVLVLKKSPGVTSSCHFKTASQS